MTSNLYKTSSPTYFLKPHEMATIMEKGQLVLQLRGVLMSGVTLHKSCLEKLKITHVSWYSHFQNK